MTQVLKFKHEIDEHMLSKENCWSILENILESENSDNSVKQKINVLFVVFNSYARNND